MNTNKDFSNGVPMSQEELKRAYPDQPWRWRREWLNGRIRDSSKSLMVISWVFAAFWILMSAPLIFLVVNEFAKGDYLVLFILLIPIVGVILIVRAVLDTMRWRKFGAVVLVVETMPAIIGASLRGRIETQSRVESPHGVQLRFACIRRITRGMGKGRNTTDELRFEEKKVAPYAAMTPSANGWQIPVQFDVPAHFPQTDDSNFNNRTFWLIEAKAAIPGVDFSSQFEVPVFKDMKERAAK